MTAETGEGPTVLYLLRPDHRSVPGGDVAQIRTLVSGLRAAGVDAVAASWDDDPPDPDVVVLANLWLPERLALDADAVNVRWPAALLAVLPIFWTYDLRSVVRGGDPQVLSQATRRALNGRRTWRSVRRVLRRAVLITPQTRAEADLIARYYRLVDPPMSVVPAPIDLELWGTEPATSLDLVEGAFRVAGGTRVAACVGRLEPRKNQLGAIRALDQVAGVTLVIAGGDHPTDRRYARRVREAAAARSDRVEVIGQVDRRGVQALLARADVLVNPSYMEVASTVVIEAAASGCEVVAADSPPVREDWGRLVRTCRPDDARSIGAAVEAALREGRQPELAARAAHFDVARVAPIAAAALRDAVRAPVGP